MNPIRFSTRTGQTRIYIPGSMKKITDLVGEGNTVLLVDENVLKFHSDKLGNFPLISIPEGENSKSLGSYDRIFQQLLDLDVDRSWKLVGIGGGITTDLSGFVASTFFRGLGFGYVATTLLGQVDAAIGGKNGINYKGYKNLIGVINQPDFVLCDTDALRTLPKNEFIGGFAEVIKYAFISRGDLYPFLVENLAKAILYDPDTLEYIIRESVLTKVGIVENDEFERGERKLLNFGHTFAHALEKLYGISHGEAVAIGMMLAIKLSVNLRMLNPESVSKLENLLISAGLPVHMHFDPEEMADTMKRDKKRKKDSMQFILLEDIGKAVVKELSINELTSVLNDLH